MTSVLQVTFVVLLFVVASFQENCTITNNDTNLPDLEARTGQPEAACCAICEKTVGCKGFAWNESEGGTCLLKGEAQDDTTLPKISLENGNGDDSGPTKDGQLRAVQPNKPHKPQKPHKPHCSSRAGIVNFNEFTNAVRNNGFPPPSHDQYNNFVQFVHEGLIYNKEEAAMALAQFIHESGGLQYKSEIKCVNNPCPEYRHSCDKPGKSYYGRGYIQLTWCYNYKAASYGIFNDPRIYEDPDSVAHVESYAWRTAFWFWKENVHNAAVTGQFGSTTRKINGDIECNRPENHHYARKRFTIYGRVRAAFGLQGQGNERGCYN